MFGFDRKLVICPGCGRDIAHWHKKFKSKDGKSCLDKIECEYYREDDFEKKKLKRLKQKINMERQEWEKRRFKTRNLEEGYVRSTNDSRIKIENKRTQTERQYYGVADLDS